MDKSSDLTATALDALRHYVADHPHDWDLSSDAVTFAYKNANAPCHQVFAVRARSFPTAELFGYPAATDYRLLQGQGPILDEVGSMARAKVQVRIEGIKKEQKRYKKYFDRRVRLPKRELSSGCFVFVRREYANLKTAKKHKLSPIADGPYLVIGVQETTVGLEIDGQHERLSLDRVVQGPSPPQYIIEHDRDNTRAKMP